MRRLRILGVGLLLTLPVAAQDGGDVRDGEPVVMGHGVGLFTVGEVLVKDDFGDMERWVVQVEEKEGGDVARVEVRDGALDCYVPGRGCTVWFKEKLKTRVAITYDVVCPTPERAVKGLMPRDLNHFWMAMDPLDAAGGLFDAGRYTGSFKTYDKLHGYYASTGGGKNTTTRMRRYPRELDGKAAAHIALTDKDGQRAYLLPADRRLRVQLVAFDDVVQYFVDGKLVYQMRAGDVVRTEGPGGDGRVVYDLERWPVYREGYFGWRMVGTHHVYSNFKVWALEPDGDGRGRPTVRVDSLEALRGAIAESGQQIVMEPGDYRVADRGGLRFSGSDNGIDLTGVRIEVPWLRLAAGECDLGSW